MKSFLLRTAALTLALISLLAYLPACNSEETDETTIAESVSTVAQVIEETTTEETELAPKVYLTVNAANASAVTIVRSNGIPATLSTELALYTAFRKEINNRFGADFALNTDSISNDPNNIEIIVGDTTREVSLELVNSQATQEKPWFGIIVRGNKIAVNGSSLYLVFKALDCLITDLTSTDESGNLQIKLEDGFTHIVNADSDYPDPEEVMNSGREYAFYSIEKLASVPTKGNYSVLQGGGTDGKYAYYAMINKSTAPETSMIYKFDLKTWELVATSKSLPTAHTNDITYDSKNHRLVVAYCSSKDGTTMSSPGIVFVNPDDLSFIEYIDAPTISRGLDYLPEKNQYILAAGYTFYLTDEKFNTISSFVCGYPQLTTQGMCTDGKYIYDPRWKSGSRYQTITINTLDGKFIAAVPFYNVDGEPENLFRDGNSFVMGCNNSDAVFRIALLYKNWWE